PRVDHEHETVPAWVDRDDANRKRRPEQADPPIGLREQCRGIDEGQVDAVAFCDLLGEDGGAGGEPQPGTEDCAGAAANGDDHIAIATIRRRWITSEGCRPISQRVLARTKFAPFGNNSMSSISTR